MQITAKKIYNNNVDNVTYAHPFSPSLLHVKHKHRHNKSQELFRKQYVGLTLYYLMTDIQLQ